MASAVLLLTAAEGVILALAIAPWLLWTCATAYLLALVFGAAVSRRSPRPVPARTRRLCLLIPAHNEELLLGAVLERLRVLEYPPESYQVVVIADNCT
ncbi:MAG TPA: hypothetical protein VNJ09_09560, partial [Chthonomonadales bacterium]|nr:hypothetical protein [Chthonomonadales bacterium]